MRKKRKQVIGGGLHPIALVRETLIQRERQHELQFDQDQPEFGHWPDRRYLWDMVAAVWQDEARFLWKYGMTEKQYWRLKNKVEIAVFGIEYEKSWWNLTK